MGPATPCYTGQAAIVSAHWPGTHKRPEPLVRPAPDYCHTCWSPLCPGQHTPCHDHPPTDPVLGTPPTAADGLPLRSV